MRIVYRVLIAIEVIVCFVPITAWWLLGVPLALGSLSVLASGRAGSLDDVGAVLFIVGSVLGGACGLVALGVLLYRLLGARRPLRHSGWVLAGFALGILPILPYALFMPGSSRAYAIAPIAASAHLIYLGRGLLFRRHRAEVGTAQRRATVSSTPGNATS